jgi:hypothetical protein
MKAYKDQFKPCKPSHDLIFKGVGRSNKQRIEHLYPYGVDDVWYALITKVKEERVKFVDNLTLDLMRL